MATSGPPSSSGSSSDPTPPTTQMPVNSPKKQRRRRRIYRPAKNSLYDLMHEHVGTSLFVRPICWTDLHSEVLGTRWEELPPCLLPVPESIPGSPPSKGHMRPSQTIKTLSDALSQILLPDTIHPILCSNAVKTILHTLWPEPFNKPHYLPEMHLFFGGRVYRDAVRAQVMWNFPTEAKSSYSSFKSVSTRPADSFNVSPTANSPVHNLANLPMLSYISKNHLASFRRNIFRVAPGPDRSWNEPVRRLQQLRAKQLVPADSDHDAHFVAMFLAMAQKHFYTTPPASSRREISMLPGKEIPPCPDFHDVTLRILTHDTDTAEFIVYTGHVTAEFLERFHYPCRVPSNDEEAEVKGIKIEYTRVPIWPILGLRERLGKALGQDVVGQFDPDEIEKWESDSGQNNGVKRKREALSEVFNESFEQESDDEPALSAKKRCLREGAPIGVVM